MHHLQTGRATTYYPITTYGTAPFHGQLLVVTEMEKAQQKATGTVRDLTQEGSPAPEGNLSIINSSLDQNLHVMLKAPHRCDTGSVLVTQGQVE
jgi:hypothetical protein